MAAVLPPTFCGKRVGGLVHKPYGLVVWCIWIGSFPYNLYKIDCSNPQTTTPNHQVRAETKFDILAVRKRQPASAAQTASRSVDPGTGKSNF